MGKIEQHIYTRGKRGYQTVARSQGLVDNFIEKNILPYCVYSAGEGGKCLTAVHYPCGRMLLGQAVHVPVENNRAVFFQHNYIVPPEKAGDALVNIFDGVAFQKAHDTSVEILPGLEALPVGDMVKGKEPDFDFDRLIHLLLQSSARKEFYIFVPSGDVHTYALTVLAALYPRLPAPLRHVLGFCTSSREPVNKKGVHLIFTDNPHIKGDILMDLNEKSGIIKDTARDGDFFAARFAEKSVQWFGERIFDEIDFWMYRLPETVQSKSFTIIIKTYMAQVLDANSILPEAFIRRGKSGKYAEITGHAPADFVVADILRQVSHPNTAPGDLRYIIGSHRLSPSMYEKVLCALQAGGFTYDIHSNDI
jgi:hypothetical protein